MIILPGEPTTAAEVLRHKAKEQRTYAENCQEQLITFRNQAAKKEIELSNSLANAEALEQAADRIEA